MTLACEIDGHVYKLARRAIVFLFDKRHPILFAGYLRLSDLKTIFGRLLHTYIFWQNIINIHISRPFGNGYNIDLVFIWFMILWNKVKEITNLRNSATNGRKSQRC